MTLNNLRLSEIEILKKIWKGLNSSDSVHFQLTCFDKLGLKFQNSNQSFSNLIKMDLISYTNSKVEFTPLFKSTLGVYFGQLIEAKKI
jgi:hypothetical protein